MMDIILVGLLLAVAGSLIWMEHARLFARATPEDPDQTAIGDSDQTEIGGGAPAAERTMNVNFVPRPGYFWRLARPAGLSPDQAWPWYLGAKVVLTLLLPLLGSALFGFGSLGLIVSALVGFLFPDAILMAVRRSRQANIRRSLSFFLDLLVSLLQAGLGLEEAFKRTAREGLAKDHPLAEEATLVVEELDLGRDRTAGFQALADRTGVRELRGLANALGLGLGMGTSVEATLRAQADLARAKRREEGLRRLNVAGAHILLPLILCGFPVFVVLVFFPLAIQVLENLQALSAALR